MANFTVKDLNDLADATNRMPITVSGGAGDYDQKNAGSNIVRVIDLAKIIAVRGSALAAGDTIDLFDVTAGMIVTDLHAEVTVVSKAGRTIDIGDQTDGDRYVTALSTAVLGGESVASASRNHYVRADEKTVRLLFKAGVPDQGTIVVYANVVETAHDTPFGLYSQ